MSDLTLGKSKNVTTINTSTLKGGMKLTAFKTPQEQSIFKMADKNNDGILDDKEIAEFNNSIKTVAKDDNLSSSEAKKFLKENNLKDVDPETLYKFSENIAKNSENIESCKQDSENNVIVKYKDGSQETLKPGKTSEIMTTDTNGSVTTTSLDANKNITSKTIKNENSETVINYEENKPATKCVNKGTVQTNYTYDENGNEVLNSKIENKGHDVLEKTTNYSYGNDGTVTENISQAGNKNITRTSKDGVLISETCNEPGKQIDKKYDDNGKLKNETVINGENSENYNTKNEITYNDDGSRTEVFSQPSKNYTQKNTYNSEGYKLTEETEVNGQVYSAKFDGKGHGTLTMKAGETIESFSQRTGVPVKDIKANNKFPGGVPQAGQQIVVPDKYVKATDSNSFAVSQKAEKAKGDAAETKLNNTLKDLSETYVQTNTKGKYKSYEDYAVKLLANEGISPASEQLINKTAKRISEMNANKDISSLESIKCPVSPQRKNKLTEIDNKNRQISTAGNVTTNINKDLTNAKASFDAQMKKDGIFEMLPTE